MVGKLKRGDVSGLGESTSQRNGALKFVVVIVRRIGAGCSLKSYRRVQDGVVGAAALVDHGGIDVRLERRPNLAQGLGRAVEFGEIEVAATDHGLDLAGRVFDGDERSFSAGILLQADTSFRVRIEGKHFDIDDIASAENVGQLEFGPCSISRRQRGGAPAEADFGGAWRYAHHQRVYISVDLRLLIPIRVLVFVERLTGRNYVHKFAVPTMAALVSCEAIEQRLPCRFLQIHIQRGVNAQAVFEYLIAAILRFEVAA